MIHIARIFLVIPATSQMFVSQTIPIIRMIPVSGKNTAGDGEQGETG
jgi:hypothetical protein